MIATEKKDLLAMILVSIIRAASLGDLEYPSLEYIPTCFVKATEFISLLFVPLKFRMYSAQKRTHCTANNKQ